MAHKVNGTKIITKYQQNTHQYYAFLSTAFIPLTGTLSPLATHSLACHLTNDITMTSHKLAANSLHRQKDVNSGINTLVTNIKCKMQIY